MLKSKMNWKIEEAVELQSEPIHPSPVISRMLAKRNIHTKEEAEAFLNPHKDNLHDPFLFEEMEIAVKRIKQAIEQHEKIMIYGDYDADGVTSTAILVMTLKQMGAAVDYYIPNRFTEGYGPNAQAFEAIRAHDVDLIITVDNGIAAPKEAQLARELGMDLIITDHHEGQDELPEAIATIHPNLSTGYPFDHLAGAGVALKVAQALMGKLTDEMLSLAAIGTVADLVPVIGENRILVKEGLAALKQTRLPGLMALKNAGKLAGEMTSEDIGFVIGPRLNAVGRLQDADLAVDLLLEQDPVIASEMAAEVEKLNQERQKLVQKITEEAIEVVEEKHQDDYVLVIAGVDWNPGVLGIVASRLLNKYHRPTIMLNIDSEQQLAKGSARSIPGFDIFRSGMAFRHLFVHFGGHPQAAGMAVRTEDIDELRSQLNQMASEQLLPEDFHPTLEIEEIIDWEAIDMSFPELIDQLAPFGMNNNRPIFQISDVEVKNLRKIGAKKNHLKLTGTCGSKMVEAVGFQIGDVADRLSPGSTIDLAGEIQINEWNGNRKLQVLIKDVRCEEWQLFDYRGKPFQLPSTISSEDVTAVYFNEQRNRLGPAVRLVEAAEIQEPVCKHLIITDLPNSLDELEEVLERLEFESLYLCFPTNQSTYFNKFPSRNDFKDLYVTIRKHQVIQKDQRGLLAEAKKVTVEELDFMLEVFFDLDFVKLVDGDVYYVEQTTPKNLTDSVTYQQRIKRMELEKTLYYSSYNELKDWISLRRGRKRVEGEVVHGL